MDLAETASHGYHYYDTLRSQKEQNKDYNKEYHEEVNDYTKNISQGIFSPGLSIEQYTAMRQKEDPRFQTAVVNMKRAQSVGRDSRRHTKLGRNRPQTQARGKHGKDLGHL